MKHIFTNLVLLIIVLVYANGCKTCTDNFASNEEPMIVAYRYLLNNWAPLNEGNKRRGYNIAAILVDPNGKIVSMALNSVIESQDCTQHAEMKLIQGYLHEKHCFNLNGYSVYTTLEPCAMCAMTMSMAGISTIYYGQTDEGFGNAIERMAFDSTQYNGFAPYPRVSKAHLLKSQMQEELEKAFKASNIKQITKWLATDDAREIIIKHLKE